MADAPVIELQALKTLATTAKQLGDAVGTPPDQWDRATIQQNAVTLAGQVGSVAEAVNKVTQERDRLKSQAARVRAVCQAAQTPAGPQHSLKDEMLFDATRLLLAWGVAFLARCVQTNRAGWTAIIATDAYIVAVLMAAAIRSDEIYAIRQPFFHSALYELMPSRLVAPIFVAGLFCALWWGFAALYAPYMPPGTPATLAPYTAASQLSFLTLGTFSGPEAYPALASLITFELGSAILLVICVFSMLINRISEF